jgi:hypothetical protein
MANSQDRIGYLGTCAKVTLGLIIATLALAIAITIALGIREYQEHRDLIAAGQAQGEAAASQPESAPLAGEDRFAMINLCYYGMLVLAELASAALAITGYGLVRARLTAHLSMGVIAGRLNRLESVLDASRVELKKMADVAPLSDQAKTMIFRERELEAVQEVVNACLVQQHYEQALKVIDRMEQQFGYKEEADRLRLSVRANREATIEGRVNDAIERLNPILAQKNWERAMRETQRLMEAFPENEKAKQLPARIAAARAEHKRALLGKYDEAVKRNDLDESISLLQELDRYLSPQEAAALQESARGVFRAKLNSLGVQFSLAVDAKRWDQAVTIGEQIMTGYPNSKMAVEVRQKLDQLKNLAATKGRG